MAYAAKTTVSCETSRADIERTLRRYEADGFLFAEDNGQVLIGFRMVGRMIRFKLRMPVRDDPTFTTYKQGYREVQRVESAAEKLWEQACRQRWRALALVIKAKLEAVEAGIATIEDEFLANTMTSDGRTVSEIIQPQIEEGYRLGGPPRLLLEHRP